MTSQPRTPVRERVVEAGETALAVAEYPVTDHPPLLLLHGIGSRGVSWWPVIDALALHFHLFAVDLRGHGGSSKPVRGYRLADYAADLAALVDALGIERPRLLGHSLGALVALTWAAANPDRAAAIALEDPPVRTEPRTLTAFDGWQALAAMPVAEVVAYYRQEYPDWTEEDRLRRAESITATAPAVFVELRAEAEAALAGGWERLAPLAAVRSPILLLRGDREAGSAVDPADAARIAALMPTVRVEHIRGAGHSLHRDQPAAFLAAVVPFLTNP